METHRKFREICQCQKMFQLLYRKVVLCSKLVWCMMMNTYLCEHVFDDVFNQFLSVSGDYSLINLYL
jgi:hypothetical protein